MERQAYSKVMWKGSPWCRNGGYGKGDGLNLSSRPRKGNVHTRPPLLCRVALSYASVAPTSSSKRRLDQLPSRCSIALVAFRVKIPVCFHQCLLRSTIYWSIACLYEHDLVLLLLVIPHSHVCKSTKRSCCLVVFRILHWNKLAASWTQNVSLQAELTNEKTHVHVTCFSFYDAF